MSWNILVAGSTKDEVQSAIDTATQDFINNDQMRFEQRDAIKGMVDVFPGEAFTIEASGTNQPGGNAGISNISITFGPSS